MNRLFRYHAIFTQFLQRPSRIPILAIDARLCLFHPRADEARVPPEQRTGLSECRQSGRAFDHEFTQTPLAKHASFGVTTRKCQNCPVRESPTWTILGVEREFASIERAENTAEGIWSSLRGGKRPLDCLIWIAKQSFLFEHPVSARIAERASIAAAREPDNLRTFVS